MRCKVRFRNIEAPRFTSGGGMMRLNMEIDRCTGIVRVWRVRHRDVAELTLPVLAKIVMDRRAAALAREKLAARKHRRLVRRGLLGCAFGER